MTQRIFFFTLLAVSSSVGQQDDRESIKTAAKQFSAHVLAKDYKSMAGLYWKDAVLLPPARDAIMLHDSVFAYWSRHPEYKYTYYRIIEDSIEIFGDVAFDYGYWYAEGEQGETKFTLTSGKYLAIWKKKERCLENSIQYMELTFARVEESLSLLVQPPD